MSDSERNEQALVESLDSLVAAVTEYNDTKWKWRMRWALAWVAGTLAGTCISHLAIQLLFRLQS